MGELIDHNKINEMGRLRSHISNEPLNTYSVSLKFHSGKRKGMTEPGQKRLHVQLGLGGDDGIFLQCGGVTEVRKDVSEYEANVSLEKGEADV